MAFICWCHQFLLTSWLFQNLNSLQRNNEMSDAPPRRGPLDLVMFWRWGVFFPLPVWNGDWGLFSFGIVEAQWYSPFSVGNRVKEVVSLIPLFAQPHLSSSWNVDAFAPGAVGTQRGIKVGPWGTLWDCSWCFCLQPQTWSVTKVPWFCPQMTLHLSLLLWHHCHWRRETRHGLPSGAGASCPLPAFISLSSSPVLPER